MAEQSNRMIKISVREEVLSSFPSLRISGLVANQLTVSDDQPLEIETHSSDLKNLEWGPYRVSAEEEIAAWRSVYGQMGVKPSKVKCSLESLFRRFLKDQSPFGINNVVDAYNAISLKYRLCMGAYDLDRLGQNLTLRYAQEGEEMLPIGTHSPLILTEKTIVYADENQVTCAFWNHRDAEETKISIQTKNGIFFVDEIIQKQGRAEQALEELADMIKSVSGAVTSQFFHLDKDTPSIIVNCVLSPR